MTGEGGCVGGERNHCRVLCSLFFLTLVPSPLSSPFPAPPAPPPAPTVGCLLRPGCHQASGKGLKLRPPMTSLDLRGARLTDEGLAALASWPHLHRLRLSGNDDVTDEGVAQLVEQLGTSLQVRPAQAQRVAHWGGQGWGCVNEGTGGGGA